MLFTEEGYLTPDSLGNTNSKIISKADRLLDLPTHNFNVATTSELQALAAVLQHYDEVNRLVAVVRQLASARSH